VGIHCVIVEFQLLYGIPGQKQISVESGMDVKSTRYCVTTISMFKSSYFCFSYIFVGLIFTLVSRFFDMMQHFGDCGYFKWADNELSTYERKMLQRLNDIEEHSWA
jgi:hypothetical protein